MPRPFNMFFRLMLPKQVKKHYMAAQGGTLVGGNQTKKPHSLV